jgi:signal transduction histidine kinase
MRLNNCDPLEYGLEVIDLREDAAFNQRRLRPHDRSIQMEGMRRIARAFVDAPETILQELATAAVELCGADSAGISMERDGRTEQQYYHWVATAGEYSPFLDATLPQFPSACTICLERGGPQIFRVHQRFFDLLGIDAPLVTDGILLPWEVDGSRGTIFAMAHGREEAFDREDSDTLQLLANFAAMGVRQLRQQKQLLQQARDAATAAMANELAHRINNPLQSLTNTLYLAANGHYGKEAAIVGGQSASDLERLSSLVRELLAIPTRKNVA